MGNAIVADPARSLPPDDDVFFGAPRSAFPTSVPPMSVDQVPHLIEREVCRRLSATPGLDVSNLVVRRIPNGVCLSGVVETCDEDIDISGIARKIPGVEHVINQLLVRVTAAP